MSFTPRLSETSQLEFCSAELAPAHLASLGLTPRECEVMRWIDEGKRDCEIASILGLSRRTVEKHVGNIFKKLNVETRTAAAHQCRYSCDLSHALLSKNGSANDRTRLSQARGGKIRPSPGAVVESASLNQMQES